MGKIFGECAKKSNEVSSLEEWTKWHRTGVKPLEDGTGETTLSSKGEQNVPKKSKPKAKAKSEVKDGVYDSDFCDKLFFSNPTSSSMSSGVILPYAVRSRHFCQRLPLPGLRILTKKKKTVSLDSGVHCWLWVDDTKTAIIFNLRTVARSLSLEDVTA